MRKPDSRITFISKVAAREQRVNHLRQQNDPDARRELKKMNTVVMGKTVPTNVKGVYGKSRPCRGKVTAKTRHHTSAAKAIMSGR